MKKLAASLISFIICYGTFAQNIFNHEQDGLVFRIAPNATVEDVDPRGVGRWPMVTMNLITMMPNPGDGFRYKGKFYDRNAFGGEVWNAISAIQVTSVRMDVIVEYGNGKTTKIYGNWQMGTREGNSVINTERGFNSRITGYRIERVIYSGLSALKAKIDELERREAQQKQQADNFANKPPQNQPQQNNIYNSGNQPINKQNVQQLQMSKDQQQVYYQQQLQDYQQKLRELEYRKQQAFDNLTNTLVNVGSTIYNDIQRNKEEKRRREELAALQEEQRRMELELKKQAKEARHQGRLNIINTFREGQFPTSSTKVNGNELGYFFYAYNPNDDLSGDQLSFFVSNAFTINKQADGSWPLKRIVFDEISKLVPQPVILHGYYGSLEEAAEMRASFVQLLTEREVQIQNINYTRKKSTAGSGSGNGTNDFWGNTTQAANSTTDFWGNEIKSGNAQEGKQKTETKASESDTDFWGNEKSSSSTIKSTPVISATSTKKEIKTDFWGNPVSDEISPELDGKIVFVENFNDNSRNWLVENSENTSRQVSQGAYRITTRQGSATAIRPMPTSASSNYLFELVVTRLSGSNAWHGIVLSFEANGEQDYILFGLDENGYAGAYRLKDASFIIPKVKKPKINLNNTSNTIMVKKLADNYLLFVNDEPIGSCRLTNSLSEYHGFAISGEKNTELKVAVDNFKISLTR